MDRKTVDEKAGELLRTLDKHARGYLPGGGAEDGGVGAGAGERVVVISQRVGSTETQ